MIAPKYRPGFPAPKRESWLGWKSKAVEIQGQLDRLKSDPASNDQLVASLLRKSETLLNAADLLLEMVKESSLREQPTPPTPAPDLKNEGEGEK